MTFGKLVMTYPHRIAAYLVTVLLLAQVTIVALRYVFAIGWPWALDLLVYLFVISGLLPAITVIVRDAVVRVDVFYSTWSKPRQRIADRISLLILFFPSMGYAAWAMSGTLVRSWNVLESSPTIGGLPGYFILKTVLFLYFSGLSITALFLAFRRDPYKTGNAE